MANASMISLLEKMRHEAPQLAKRLEAGFVESPHYFASEVSAIALSLDLLGPLLEFFSIASMPADITQSALQRRLSFIGGRLCAEYALEQLGLPNQSVDRHHCGAPVWPPGTCGSITHTDQLACAAVTLASGVFSLGIDSEIIFSDREFADVRRLCCTPGEKAMLANVRNRNLIGTILFSAKESFYKSFHSIVQRYIDFSEIEIIGIDWASSALHLQTVNDGDLNSAMLTCRAFFSMTQNVVHTSVEVSHHCANFNTGVILDGIHEPNHT